jgi:pimeloyl-ACP methyl ester carboxylesterase
MSDKSFEFPVGYHKLHKTKIMDYQLNRWFSFGYWRLEDIRDAAKRIKSLEDWKPEMLRQADIALAEGRMTEAAFFYRSAEFFSLPSDPDRQYLYNTFKDTFYSHVFDSQLAEKTEVAYGEGTLPALHFRALKANRRRGTLVIHGGFDSFMEEFYSWSLWFSHLGYEVILFEGPGQGGALKKYDLPFTHEWEKPAKAVLDHFDLNDVSWMGISMGGWLCFRAAAFEPRIRRVIASSIILLLPPRLKQFVSVMLRFPRLLNGMAKLNARLQPQENWAMHQLMYIYKAKALPEAVAKIMEFNIDNQYPERVEQDVLILTGKQDHFVPFGMQQRMHNRQVNALVNARSVTGRIFTEEEHAQNHCQVGNIGLALKEVENWISANEIPESRKIEQTKDRH